MKFHDPEWVGKVVNCSICKAAFTLEADDEKLVKYARPFITPGINMYRLKCPKCSAPISFEVASDRGLF